MKLSGRLAYFCDKGHENAPVVEITKSGRTEWPVRIAIGASDSADAVDIYCDEQQLVAFKNSVISAYEAFSRRK